MSTITKTSVLSKIRKIRYSQIPDSTMILCAITMMNGFVVIGESACLNPATFSVTKGENLAYDEAISKIINMEAYLHAEHTYKDKSESSNQAENTSGISSIKVSSISELIDVLKSIQNNKETT